MRGITENFLFKCYLMTAKNLFSQTNFNKLLLVSSKKKALRYFLKY